MNVHACDKVVDFPKLGHIATATKLIHMEPINHGYTYIMARKQYNKYKGVHLATL